MMGQNGEGLSVDVGVSNEKTMKGKMLRRKKKRLK